MPVQGPTVVFSDPEIETEEIFASFLGLLQEQPSTSAQIISLSRTDSVAKLAKVGLFCLKWDCKIGYQLLLGLFIGLPWYEPQSTYLDLFTLGSLLDDPEVCVRAIRCVDLENAVWKAPFHLRRGQTKKPMFNPLFWKFKTWDAHPSAYAFALLKTFNDSDTKVSKDELFLGWLRAMKGGYA